MEEKKEAKPVFLFCHRGALGDFLFTLPTLLKLRFHFPKHLFFGLGKSDHFKFAMQLGLVDNFADAEYREWLPFFEGRVFNTKLTPLSQAVLFGSENDPLTELCKRNGCERILMWPPHPPEPLHAIDHHWNLLSHFSVPSNTQHKDLLPPPPEKATRTLIHPGAGGQQKRFNPEFYLFVANELKNLGYPDIHFILGPQEKSLTGHYSAHYPILTPTSLLDCYCDLGGAALYIGNDSGVTHLSALCGIPTVAFYKSTSPKQWGLRGVRVSNLEAESEALAMAKLQKALRNLSPGIKIPTR